MERATQRWLVILVVVVAVYLALELGHWVFGAKIVPW